MKSGKELTIEWFERVWNSRERSAISELMCNSCEVKGLNLSERGPDAFEQFYDSYCRAFENIQIEVLEMAEESELVVGNAQFRGVHIRSGKDIDLSLIHI